MYSEKYSVAAAGKLAGGVLSWFGIGAAAFFVWPKLFPDEPTDVRVVRDRAQAEEVTQDAFLRLCERWRGLQAVEYPEAWVRRVHG